jgi:inhibitor of KinA sporulation pathway (predicted exonuclease)
MAWLRYAVCLDVEATFARGRSDVPGGRFDARVGPEIVQVGVAVLDLETGDRALEFCRAVRPAHNAVLSRSLMGLTGLTQSAIDAARPFGEVWRELERLLVANGVGAQNSVAMTFSGADLGTFVPHQALVLDGVQLDPYWGRVVDVQRVYGEFVGERRPRSLRDALASFELKLTNAHDALGDARGLASLAWALTQNGVKLERAVEPPCVRIVLVETARSRRARRRSGRQADRPDRVIDEFVKTR